MWESNPPDFLFARQMTTPCSPTARINVSHENRTHIKRTTIFCVTITPETQANSGNRTHIFGLEDRHTSRCTMLALLPGQQGLEPRTIVLETIMFPITPQPLRFFKADYCELAICQGGSIDFSSLKSGIWRWDVPPQLIY